MFSGKHCVPLFGFDFIYFRQGIFWSVCFVFLNVVFRNVMEQFHFHLVKSVVKGTGKLETRFVSQDVASNLE